MNKSTKMVIIFILVFSALVWLNAPFCVATASKTTTGGSGTISLANPLGTNVSPQTLLGKIINAVLGLVGSLALVMFIYGGFVWMTSAGNTEKVTQGKNIIIWATIGLIIIFSAYALVNFVITKALLGQQ